MHMRPYRFVTIGIIVAAAACGSSNSSITGTTKNPPAPMGGANITIQDFSFSPAVDTVKVGTTVTWTNNGPSEHSTTSDAGIWDSGGLMPTGATFQHTFSATGSFPYHCTFHPPSLYPNFVGTIVVTN